MFAAADRIIAHGVSCAQLEPGRWSYVSLAPWPQMPRDGGGPLVSLLTAGDIGFAQISCQLDPPGYVLEQVRADITARTRAETPVTLVSGVTAVPGAELIVADAGSATVLATSGSSGYPPFAAVFSASVTGSDKDALEAALRGEHGHARVSYTVDAGEGPAELTADVAEWARIGDTGFAAPDAATRGSEEEPC